MVTITRKFKFAAAHRLPNYDGICSNLHGHSYELEVSVSGGVATLGPKKGMVIDFKDLKTIVEINVIDVLDHSDLNEIFDNPTAEEMVKYIFVSIRHALSRIEGTNGYGKLILSKVRLYENPGEAWAEIGG